KPGTVTLGGPGGLTTQDGKKVEADDVLAYVRALGPARPEPSAPPAKPTAAKVAPAKPTTAPKPASAQDAALEQTGDVMRARGWTFFRGYTNKDGSQEDVWIPRPLGNSMTDTDTSGGIVVFTHKGKVSFKNNDTGKSGVGMDSLNAYLTQNPATVTRSDNAGVLSEAGWKSSGDNPDGTTDWTHPQFGSVKLNPDGSLRLDNGQRV